VSVTLRIVRRDARDYVLFDGAAEVGWLRGGSVGFCGFADRARARIAGEVAASVLADWYATRWYSAPHPFPSMALPDDQIATRGVVVGRVVGPDIVPVGSADSHGFELALPREVWVAVILELAQRIHAAVAQPRLPLAAAST
jgi:hypothetical protein